MATNPHILLETTSTMGLKISTQKTTLLGEWRCCVDRAVPEAIRNHVAIKLLVSGLLTWRIYCVYLFFYILTGFVFEYFLSV